MSKSTKNAVGADIPCDAYVPWDEIDPDPTQPRRDATPEYVASIRANGILQALIVRPHPEVPDRWMLVDGECRWRSAKGVLPEIPISIRYDLEGRADRLVVQLTANKHKAMRPLDLAHAYKEIIQTRRAEGHPKFGVVQLADELGESKSTVSDRLALADVPEPFVPLFARGELSSAAAPIVRKLTSGIPSSVLAKAIKEARENYDWNDAVEEKRPVALATAQTILEDEIAMVLRQDYAELTDPVAKRYQGEVVAFDGQVYAVDRTQADRIAAELAAAAEKRRGAPAKAAPEQDWQKQARERAAKERKALKAKQDKRRAQFAAVAAHLPEQLSSELLLLVIAWTLDELTNDSRRAACKLLNLEPRKTKYGGWDCSTPIAEYAATLSEGKRVALLLHVLLAADSVVTQYGGDWGGKRIRAAAELIGVDLAASPADASITRPLAVVQETLEASFSVFVTRGLTKREKTKTLAQMSNAWVEGQIQHAREQIAKYDDREEWPDSRLQPGMSREITFFGARDGFFEPLTREDVSADLARLEAAARIRGLLDNSDDEAEREAEQQRLADNNNDGFGYDDELWDSGDEVDEDEPEDPALAAAAAEEE